jgi:iron complex outermembrane recepter protein
MTSMQRDLPRPFRLLAAASALVSTCAMVPTQAQENPPSSGSADSQAILEAVVVTGTLIRDYRSPSPVLTVNEALIADTGATVVQDLFKGLTANAGSQQNNEQSALQGVSQFSLRGLGVGSTLTLINGRRAGLAPITDETGQLFTDSNAFPVNAIERIEVLTDGASATYGSEAVAGVVNIITRKDFQGFELTSDVRQSVVDSYQVGFAFGQQFERGRFTAFGSYRGQTGAFRSDIDVMRRADAANTIDNVPFGAVFNSATSAPGRFTRAVPSTGPGGYALAGNTLADPDCVAAGGILRGTTCRYAFIDQRRAIAEEDRLQFLAQFDYELSDAVTVFGELSQSRNEIRDAIGGTVLNRTQVAGGFLVPASHPFNYFVANGTGIRYAGPAEFAANPSLTAVDLIYRGRPLGAAHDGRNAEDLTTIFDNQRLVLGLDSQIGSWNLNASYTNASNRYNRSQPYDFDSDLFQQALLDGTFNPFGTAIAQPDLVGRDGTSLAGNTAAEINSFAFVINDVGEVTQEVAEVILSGQTPLQLPGGAVALALGAQGRSVAFQNTPDGRRQSGDNGRDEIEPAIPLTRQDAYALFGEVALPILERFSTQLAVRLEDYGKNGGSTVDPKISALFDVTDSLSLRGSYGTSFQAPSIRQIAGSVGNDSVTDPRLGAAGGSFNVTVFTRGSQDLKPQSASNLNLGIVLNSSFGLVATVDYFTYRYTDLILPGGDPQSIVDAVEAGELPADRIVRDGAGQVRQVFSEFLNRGDADAAGVDVNLSYDPTWWERGDLTLFAQSTIITKFRSSEFPGLDGNGDLKGSRNFANAFGSVPDFKLNAGATLALGRHEFSVTGRYIGEYTDDQADLPIEDQLVVDARYTLSLDGFLGGETSALTIGALNLLDEDPPTIINRPLYDTEVHDPKGRQVYLSLKHKF